MAIPVEIAFHGVDRSDTLTQRIEKEAHRLERFFKRIQSCRVVVERPHHRHHKGDLFSVHIHLRLPDGREIEVKRNPEEHHAHEDPYVAVRDAFKAASRRVQDEALSFRGEVKSHEPALEGRVVKLLAEKNCGFIRTIGDDHEVYFHRNSVAGNFDELEVGRGVHFSEEAGENGLQAVVVRPFGRS